MSMEMWDQESYEQGYAFGADVAVKPHGSYEYLCHCAQFNGISKVWIMGLHRAIQEKYPDHKMPSWSECAGK